MDNPEIRIPEDITPEVLALASRYYANQQQSSSIPTKYYSASTPRGSGATGATGATATTAIAQATPNFPDDRCLPLGCQLRLEYVDVQLPLKQCFKSSDSLGAIGQSTPAAC
jgi:hypothetical protein